MGDNSVTLNREFDNKKTLSLDDLDDPETSVKREQNYDFFMDEEEPPRDPGFGEDLIANKDLLVDNDKPEEFSDISSEKESEIYGRSIVESNDNPEEENMSYDDMQQQKAYFLSQLKRLESKGHVPSRRFGMEHSLNEVKSEVFKIRKEIETDRGINYCRQGLMFCVSTLEMLNTKYDPFGVQLDGWSSVIMADKENYDDVFEELYQKYATKMQMAPEIKLMTMLAGSALMFHMQKSMMTKREEPATIQKHQPPPPAVKKMKGPSINLDDAFSDISSEASETPVFTKTVNVPTGQKKRGRPAKKQ